MTTDGTPPGPHAADPWDDSDDEPTGPPVEVVRKWSFLPDYPWRGPRLRPGVVGLLYNLTINEALTPGECVKAVLANSDLARKTAEQLVWTARDRGYLEVIEANEHGHARGYRLTPWMRAWLESDPPISWDEMLEGPPGRPDRKVGEAAVVKAAAFEERKRKRYERKLAAARRAADEGDTSFLDDLLGEDRSEEWDGD